MQLVLYAVLFLAVAGVIGAGYKTVKDSGREEVRLEWAKANEEARKKSEAQMAKAAADLAKERKKRKVVVQQRTVYVDRIVEKPVYRNECLDADGLRCLGAAIRNESAAGCKPEGTVRTAPPTK